jgi:hypothetical protein
VVHSEQLNPVNIRDLFHRLTEPQLIPAVPEGQLLGFDFDELASLGRSVLAGSDEVANSTHAGKVTHEREPLPAPGEQHGATGYPSFRFTDPVAGSRGQFVFTLRHTVRPHKRQIVGLRRAVQAEDQWSLRLAQAPAEAGVGDHLAVQTTAQLQSRAEPAGRTAGALVGAPVTGRDERQPVCRRRQLGWEELDCPGLPVAGPYEVGYAVPGKITKFRSNGGVIGRPWP